MAYGGASLDAALVSRGEGLTGADRALFREISYGGLRWFWRCKGVMERLVARPLRKRDRLVEAVVIVGLYQLDRMRLPPHAAIHATVQACAALGKPGFKGLVNGVLRNFQRRHDELSGALSAPARDAHPEWLWRAIHEQWPDDAAAVIEAGNARPPMTLRVNVRAGTVAEYIGILQAEGIEGRPLAHAPEAVVLARAVDVEHLPGFASGRVSIQDASAQLLPRVARPEAGQRVLDACAAPGGKLTHLLEACPGLSIQAVEKDPERASRIVENLGRLGLRAGVTVADAAAPRAWWDGRPFDLVVLDAPCTATGVVRRHPDIKVLRRASDVDALSATQAALLDGLWDVVAPGGRLVYVTCSILAAENQAQVEAFLARADGAREEAVELPLGRAPGHGWQLLPGEGDGDGFYYAVLRRAG